MKFVKTVNLEDVNPNTGNTFRQDLTSGAVNLQRGNWVQESNVTTKSRLVKASSDQLKLIGYRGKYFPHELFNLSCKLLSTATKEKNLSGSRQVIG